MSLPASQCSTLDGEKVERAGDDTFVCTLGKLLPRIRPPACTHRAGGRQRTGENSDAVLFCPRARLLPSPAHLSPAPPPHPPLLPPSSPPPQRRVRDSRGGGRDPRQRSGGDAERYIWIDSVNRVGWTDRCDAVRRARVDARSRRRRKDGVPPRPVVVPVHRQGDGTHGELRGGTGCETGGARFLAQLKSDYAWAAGDDSREAKGADLFDVDIGSPENVEV